MSATADADRMYGNAYPTWQGAVRWDTGTQGAPRPPRTETPWRLRELDWRALGGLRAVNTSGSIVTNTRPAAPARMLVLASFISVIGTPIFSDPTSSSSTGLRGTGALKPLPPTHPHRLRAP